MKQDDWAWRPLPSKQPPDYAAGGERLWYTSGLTVQKAYLQCLLSAHTVFRGGAEGIPHGKYPSVYRMLMDGRKRRRCGAGAAAALADAAAANVEELDMAAAPPAPP